MTATGSFRVSLAMESVADLASVPELVLIWHFAKRLASQIP